MRKSWKRRESGSAKDKTEYGSYSFSAGEIFVILLEAAAATGAFAYMFYRSGIALAAWPAAAAVLLVREKKKKMRSRKERLSGQFQDAVLAVNASIQAGYSIENAFLEAEGEIGSLYGKESEMGRELALIRKGLKNRIPLEQMLLNLGVRSGVEEIKDFTEVFAAAKRSGGNMKEILCRTVDLTRQRMEVEREIAAMLAAKKYEQKVMNLIPFFLFGYLQLTSREFFDILYHNAAGVIIMTVCLALYLCACLLSEKIMDIRI